MSWTGLLTRANLWRESMSGLEFVTAHRLKRLSQVFSAQALVQVIGFATGLLLVRQMAPEAFGWFTLAMGLATLASSVGDLGLSSAVMARGGPLVNRPQSLAVLLADAHALHVRLGLATALVGLPAVALLFLHQQASPALALGAAAFAGALAWLQVRVGMALSVLRLQGAVGYLQLLDLAVNLGRLAVLGLLALWWVIDLTNALLLHLVAAAVLLLALNDALARRLCPTGPAGPAAGEHAAGLRQHVRRQAPNSIWFAFSSQITLWLVGLFGNAQGLAQVGALGRLAGVFSLVGMLVASLALPYFARPHRARDLRSGFWFVNASFAALLLLLQVLVQAWPGAVLWLLGPHYAGLQHELAWMVAAGTLGAWGGAVYSLGCARGWVLPVGVAMAAGLGSAVVAASLVDLGSVSGSYIVNTAVTGAGALAVISYVNLQLRRLARSEPERPTA